MQKKLRQGDITIQTSINQAMSFGAIPCVRNNNWWLGIIKDPPILIKMAYIGYRHFSKFGCFPNWLLKLYKKQVLSVRMYSTILIWKVLISFYLNCLDSCKRFFIQFCNMMSVNVFPFILSSKIYDAWTFLWLLYTTKFRSSFRYCVVKSKKYQILNYVFG